MELETPLYVAQPLLPDLSKLTLLLEEIWDSRIVTNGGPLHNRLETALQRHLNVPVATLTCNGTMALQCAMLSLELPAGAEVIVTPLTFAATAHAISACGLTPVFADVDEETLTLDAVAVERAITSKTVAVVGVHVYGTLCDYRALQSLCSAAKLHLLFDAAHAFGASDGDVPVGAMGDLNVFSFHATKLFNTFEGGLITARDPNFEERLRLVRNFGIAGEERVALLGINAKMSEVNAAIGLLNMEIMGEEIAARRRLRARFDAILDTFPGLRKQAHQPSVIQSEQYYMFRVDQAVFGASRDDIYNRLKEHGIFSRRYFWPICTDFETYHGWPVASVHDEPVVDRVKNQVLCLSFHSGVKPHHEEILKNVLIELCDHRPSVSGKTGIKTIV